MEHLVVRSSDIDIERVSSLIPDSKNTLIFIYGPSNFRSDNKRSDKLFPNKEKLYNQICNVFQKSTIIGVSSGTSICNSNLVINDSVIGFVHFKKASFKSLHEIVSLESDEKTLVSEMVDKLWSDDLKGIYILYDGIHLNGDNVVSGIKNSLKKNIPVVGGASSIENDEFDTWLFYNKKFSQNSIILVGFYGDVEISFGIGSGWKATKEQYPITNKDDIVYEIAGQPALDKYKEIIGPDEADLLPQSAARHPLIVVNNNCSEDERIVRGIYNVDEDKKQLLLTGNIEQASMVKIGSATIPDLISGANEAAMLTARHAKGEGIVLAGSCVARKWKMENKTRQELRYMNSFFEEGVNIIGFYTHGEIAPTDKGEIMLHNQTMTMMFINET